MKSFLKKNCFPQKYLALIVFLLLTTAMAQYQPPSSISGLLEKYRSYNNLSSVSQDDEAYGVNITTWQMSHGGFSKAMESNYLNPWDGNAELSEWYSGSTPLGMYDNDATVSEIRFLANQYQLSNSSDNRTLFKNSISKAIGFILNSQYPSGAWPQVYPERTGTTYSNLATYNDNAMVRLMVLVKDIVDARIPFEGDLISNDQRQGLESALEKGVEFALKAQILNDGKLTVWCQQHDPVSYQPSGARSYELASKSGSESVGIIAFLMNWPQQTEAVQAAVRGAVQWYQEVRVPDMKWDSPDFISSPGASLWYRFYNVENNKEFFCDRDGIKVYNITEVSMERRTGYQWGGSYGSVILNVVDDYTPPNPDNTAIVIQTSGQGLMKHRKQPGPYFRVEFGAGYNIKGRKVPSLLTGPHP